MDVMLSDNLRRLLCRALFCLLCLLPTLFTVRAVLFPLSSAGWGARISQQLGVSISLGSVESRTPQRTDFRQLLLGAEGFDSRVTIDQAVMQNLADGRVLQLGTVTASARALKQLLMRIDQATDQTLRSDRPLLIRAERVVIKSEEGAASPFCELFDTAIRVDRPGDRLQIGFSRTVGNNSARRVSIARTVDFRQITWQIDSGGTSLPAWLVRPFCPELAFLGDETAIAGRATLYQRDSGWSGELFEVTLAGLQLEALLFRKFGLPLSGTANLFLQSAAIVDGRVHAMTGMLDAQDGFIDTGWLSACEEFADMRIVEHWRSSGEVPYRQMQFRFRLRNYSLAVFSPENPDGAILTAADGSKILFAKSGQPFALANLLKILAWPHNEGSPINRYTASLAARLAWPPLPFAATNSAEALPRTADEHQVGAPVFR